MHNSLYRCSVTLKNEQLFWGLDIWNFRERGLEIICSRLIQGRRTLKEVRGHLEK